ncbi:class I SAM-dependent methyltransferase [Algivirga pacifica]|uniref:Methyltransferase domain-containing protein n=1 Tax=Algivirga pacifica TaxID=1162670 RepID=A0ABP9DPW6_9BACT
MIDQRLSSVKGNLSFLNKTFMKWYDFFSNFYDQSLEKLYADSRRRAVELLELKEGDVVLDLACGTGANFSHLKKSCANIEIYGADFSEGMLRRATHNIEKNQWEGIHLFQADARNLTKDTLSEYTGKEIKFDQVLCVLGLSVMPDWTTIMTNMLDLLKEGGKIVVVDVFAEKRDFNTWLVEKIAKADLDRPISEELKSKVNNFHMEYLPVKESKVGGKLFVAAGTK